MLNGYIGKTFRKYVMVSSILIKGQNDTQLIPPRNCCQMTELKTKEREINEKCLLMTVGIELLILSYFKN